MEIFPRFPKAPFKAMRYNVSRENCCETNCETNCGFPNTPQRYVEFLVKQKV
jgi:hypothetical protein